MSKGKQNPKKDAIAEIMAMVEAAQIAAQLEAAANKGDSRQTTYDEQQLISFIAQAAIHRYTAENCPLDDKEKQAAANEFLMGALGVLAILKIHAGANVQKLFELGRILGHVQVLSDFVEASSEDATPVPVDGFVKYIRDDKALLSDFERGAKAA